MTRPALRTVLIAAVLAAYPAFTLYPFRWGPPQSAPNGAEYLPEQGVRFAAPGIARAVAPPRWLDAAMGGHRLEIALRVRPASSEQDGPARIITLSRDPGSRNFTVGQQGDDLVVRLRTPATDRNGRPELRVPGIFRAGAWVDVRVVVEPAAVRVEVNGDERLRRALPPAPLRVWNTGHSLALGNEHGGDRPWRGDILRADVRAGGAVTRYAAPGVLEVPSPMWVWTGRRPPQLVPFQAVAPVDAVLNVLGFVPLGFLLGLLALGRGRRGWTGALLVALAVSAGIEIVQLGFAGRYTSVNDVIANVAGGAMGILLSRSRAAAARLDALRGNPGRIPP